MRIFIKYLGFFPIITFMISFINSDYYDMLILRWGSLGFILGWFLFKFRQRYISRNSLEYQSYVVLNNLQNQINSKVIKIQQSGKNESFLFNVYYEKELMFQVLHKNNILDGINDQIVSIALFVTSSEKKNKQEIFEFFHVNFNLIVNESNDIKYGVINFGLNIKHLMNSIHDFISYFHLDGNKMRFEEIGDKTIFNTVPS